ncbi:GyrI-like domain-containing protein [Paenibacillus hamazuiensis]|uniref:GyrI-like domain-containing protein n=1 Tax=Paenibacillus hamazuiensis TaxID=2936508 RepID=UPI002010C006|nr:GyrI-like domain-containing protein [Paenibacillus hamazuiensis]
MQPMLVRKEQMVIGGLKRPVNLQENREFGLIRDLYGKWESRRNEVKQAASRRTFGVEIYPAGKKDFNPETDHFDYLAGVDLAEGAELPEGMQSYVAEAGTYAVFTHRGKMDDISEFFGKIYKEWFPKSMYAPGCYDMEVYDERFLGPAHEDSVMEVWVPVTYKKPPHCGMYQNTWTTAAQALREAIKFSEKRELSLNDVMGYTGHAFRINIREDNVDVAGPTAWDWGPVLSEGLLNLGIRSSYLGEPNFTPPTPELLEKAISKVQTSLDRGIPAFAWDLFVPEFGVIFGYDDEKAEFHAKDVSKEGTIPYQKLGRGQVGELFVLTLDEFFEVDKQTTLTGALKMITEHARVRYHRHPEPPYQNGIAGYDAWIEAFRRGTVDMFGNSYNAALVCDARAHAVKFLRDLPLKWNGDLPEEREISRLAGVAAEHYQAVFDELVKLPPLYPFPQGGNPNIPANAEYTISVLERAKAAEERGVEALEKMLGVLQGA